MLQTSEPDLRFRIAPVVKVLARYAFAVVAVGLALMLDLAFSGALEPHRYAPFVFAIILVASFGDLGSSLLATFLAVAATNYSEFLAEHRLRLDADDLVQLAIFVTIAMSISILTTRRRRAERELERVNAELRELDLAKDRFIAAVSHELRTPMTVILGWAEILGQNEDEELRTAAAAAIEQSAHAQARLIEDLLDMSRLMLGKLHLQIAPVTLVPVVRQAAEMIRPAADAKRLEFSLSLPPDPCVVEGDPLRLQQICWNLLQNAVKFTPEEGRVSLTLARDGSVAEISVSDTGPGIPEQLLPRIFEPFRQGDGAADKGGLGLGLAIVRELVNAHHGTIQAASDGTGKGARFIVRLPLAA